MFAYYNPLDKEHKSVTGAVKKGETCIFKVKTDAEKCSLIVLKDGDKKPSSFNMKKYVDGFEISITPQNTGLFFYAFKLNDDKFLGLGENYLGEIFDAIKYFQILIYDSNFTTPEYIKGGLIYQIFPDRFAISGEVKHLPDRVYHDDIRELPFYLPNENGKILNNDFYGGNIKGIISKLDYLKDLNVTVIYLNPIFKSYSNHHYDTGDYFCIDPNLGDMDDLKELIFQAERRGIKIILDGVFSHTGDDSRYFNKYGRYDSIGAYQSKNSPYYDWYTFKKFPDKYNSWWGIDVLPEVNEKNSSYNDFINGKNGVIEFYTQMGIGGWRLDVADELPTQFLINLRKAVKSKNSNAIIIGEVWEDATNKISYNERRSYFVGNQLDSIMNYVLRDAIIDYVKNGNLQRLSYSVKEQIDHYPKTSLHSLMNLLGTHDTYRIINSLAGKDMSNKSRDEMAKTIMTEDEYKLGVKRLKMATLLQYTLCGVPSVYYGDEVGLQGYSDPLSRRFYGADKIDEELLSWHQKLGRIRSNIIAFKDGEMKEIFNFYGAYVFERRKKNCQVVIGTNNGRNTIVISFEGKMFNLLNDTEHYDKIELKPGEICLLYNKKI